MLVTDHPEEMEPAVCQLRSNLFDVTVMRSGWSAYYRALVAMPCVLITDAELSSMDSLTLCRLVRRANLSPRMGVILVSRGNEEQMRLAALELGVLDILPAPLDPDELMLRIAAHRRATLHNCDATPDCHMRGAEPGAQRSVVQALVDLVDREGGLAGRMRDLAKSVGTGERRLAKLFKAEMGEPLSVYLRRKRIDAACRLLSSTALPIKDISAQVGFRSPCNFTVAFQQSTGVSPSRYREQKTLSDEREHTGMKQPLVQLILTSADPS